MTVDTIEFDGFTVSVEEGWDDVTFEQPGPDSPFTLIHENEIGVLQFSAGIYRGGKKPEVSVEGLRDMLLQSASANGLGPPTNVRASDGPMNVAVGDFTCQNEFVRMWYLSDGWSFAKATYICAADAVGDEVREAERIVNSLRFLPHRAV